MPFGSLGSTRVALLAVDEGLGVESPTMVDVDEDRLKVFASGARCVSFSSGQIVRPVTRLLGSHLLLVNFQDMVGYWMRLEVVVVSNVRGNSVRQSARRAGEGR